MYSTSTYLGKKCHRRLFLGWTFVLKSLCPLLLSSPSPHSFPVLNKTIKNTAHDIAVCGNLRGKKGKRAWEKKVALFEYSQKPTSLLSQQNVVWSSPDSREAAKKGPLFFFQHILRYPEILFFFLKLSFLWRFSYTATLSGNLQYSTITSHATRSTCYTATSILRPVSRVYRRSFGNTSPWIHLLSKGTAGASRACSLVSR